MRGYPDRVELSQLLSIDVETSRRTAVCNIPAVRRGFSSGLSGSYPGIAYFDLQYIT